MNRTDELNTLKEKRNKLFEAICRFNGPFSTFDRLYDELDQLNEQIKELEEALETVEVELYDD